MKKILLALGLLASISSTSAFAGEIVNFTEVKPTIKDDGKSAIVLPDKKKTSRRRMLFDFGLFGAGLHVGWLKPKNMDVTDSKTMVTTGGGNAGNGGDEKQAEMHTMEIKRHRLHGVGWPIFNVSAGKYAVGLGTH